MKRLLLILLVGLVSFVGQAQGVEKIYLSTDRNVYIAGDEIWCSLFSLDAASGQLSSFSAVAYVELVSEEGTVASAKMGLMQGRGAGKFRIPLTAPTGNYRLLAYTAADKEAYLPGSKLVSVFNTTSTARVKGGVNLVDERKYFSSKPVSGDSDGVLQFYLRETPRSGRPFSVALQNGSAAVDLALSVYAVDDLKEPTRRSWNDFFAALPQETRRSSALAEYEGEIIYAAVEGLQERQLDSLSSVAVATLSSAGSPTDVYVGKMGDKGRLMFFTNNIYGDRELVCEVAGTQGYISLLDPFLYPEVSGLEALELSSTQYGSLVRRKAALAVSLQVDTLVDFLPRRQDILLENVPEVSYHLDDYTRFPSFAEVMVEIVKELRIRTVFGKRQLQMIVPDATGSRKLVKDNLLVMLDGVVISDLSLLEGMDAMLLEDVDIYPESLAIGGVSYNGLVNFVTRKNYVKAMPFPSHVRVVDFKGVCYPVAYLGTPVKGDDFRQLLYWHPALKLSSGENLQIPLMAPKGAGMFRIMAEGLTADGKHFREVFDFEVQ